MENEPIKTVAGNWYSLTCTAAATVTSEIDGESVTLTMLDEGGTTVFCSPSSTVTIATEGKYRVLPTKASAACLGGGGNTSIILNATSDIINRHTADTGAHLTTQEKTYLSQLVNNTAPPSSTGTLITDDDLSNANLHISLGLGSMAVGKNAVANNAYSTALGYGALTGAYYTSNNLTATITTVSTDRNGTYASSTPCFTTSIGFHASASRGGCTALGSYARAGDSLASSFGTQATAIGYFSSASNYTSSAIGSSAQAVGYSSTAVGYSATAEDVCCTAVGEDAYACGWSSSAIGSCAAAYASRANAIGSGTCVVGTGATAIGNGCFVADAGVTAINVGGLYDHNGETYSNGMSTQLYLIGAGCTLSEDYLEGESGLGFIVLDHLSGAIVARGCCKLSSICTLHTTDFTPKNCNSISQY